MSESFHIAIAGLGTVGAGVVKILQTHADITNRAGRTIEIVSVSSRDKSKDRGVDLSAYEWSDNPLAFTSDDRIDAVVELIGGEEGIAKDMAEQTLQHGKAFVTANKALLAHHGFALAELSEKHNAPLMYEASVAGGIPIIKSLREGFAANEIMTIDGILNGTCNYILTEMEKTGRAFDDVLKDAQEQGYAEAEPSFDIDGVDTAHKLCILSALAYGVVPDFENIEIEGIRGISSVDISFAAELGYRIKLLGSTSLLNGNITQTVSPCLVPMGDPIADVDGVFNAVFIEGDFVDKSLSVGRGAGTGPTASAVVADIIDLARGTKVTPFGVPASEMKEAQWADAGEIVSRFYIRLMVLDQPGVLADIATTLCDHNVSMESIIQRARDPDKPVMIVMTSHEAKQKDIREAVKIISELPTIKAPPRLLRIAQF